MYLLHARLHWQCQGTVLVLVWGHVRLQCYRYFLQWQEIFRQHLSLFLLIARQLPACRVQSLLSICVITSDRDWALEILARRSDTQRRIPSIQVNKGRHKRATVWSDRLSFHRSSFDQQTFQAKSFQLHAAQTISIESRVCLEYVVTMSEWVSQE